MYLMDYSDNYYVRTKAFSLNTNKLNESLQCDVCIIGAGLSGISSALYLSYESQKKVTITTEKNLTVKSDKLIICCNAYIDNLNKSLRKKISKT